MNISEQLNRCSDFGAKLLADPIFKSEGILSLNTHSNGTISIKFADEDAVIATEGALIRSYDGKIEINRPKPYQPVMKIVGISDLSTPAADAVAEIITANSYVAENYKYICA